MVYRQARCKARSCRAEIFWAVNHNGKKMPLDDRPLTVEELNDDPHHAYFIDGDGKAQPFEPVLIHCLDEIGSVHRSHFRTCHEADRFSGPR